MNIIFTTLLILFLIYTAQSKRIRKYYNKDNFNTTQTNIFLTKFDFGSYGGSIKIIIMHRQLSTFTQRNLIIDIVKDTDLIKYQQSPCQKYQNKPQVIINMKSLQTAKDFEFSIPQQDRQHIFYFYLSNCNNNLLNIIHDNAQQLSMEITLLNKQSHFGQDQTIFPGYILLVLAWLALIIYFFKSIGDAILFSKDHTKITAFAGLIVLGIAYFYRLLHIILYWSNGQGLYIFQYLYHILKSSCEFIIVTFISAIGWGWSITHLKHDQSYILAGVTVALINIATLIVSVSAQQMVQSHHKYDSTAGYILLILKTFILIIFIIGILRTLSLSVGNIRKFIKKFALIGGLYLSIWPLVVVFAELCLPNYMHNEIITFVEQITHLIGSGLLCKILSNPQSTYRKVSIKEEDNPLKMRNYKHK